MALDPRIASIKASGTYRFEFDKSQVVGVPANQIRLVVGFSKRGVFNTPVFVPDSTFFREVFGDIDRNLEKKGSFFHRSCLTALERGPILALNLLNLDAEDKSDFVKLSTSALPDIAQNIQSTEFRSVFNRDKFWFPDSESFLNSVNASNTFSGTTTNDLLNFTNIGKSPISIIVKKAAATNLTGFNVTVKDWYGENNRPGFLNPNSLISDFMVDVFVIGGNFGPDTTVIQPYGRFSSDPRFQKYFSATKGLKRKRATSDSSDTLLQEFFNESEVNQIASYTACLIPNFVDLVGNNLFIEDVINRDSATTGLFCAVNQTLFDDDILIDGVQGGLDLIGHTIVNNQTSSFSMLSYKGSLQSDLSYTSGEATEETFTWGVGESGELSTSGDTITITAANNDAVVYEYFNQYATTYTAGSIYVLNTDTANVEASPVTSINVDSDSSTITLTVSGIDSGIDLATAMSIVDFNQTGFIVKKSATDSTGIQDEDVIASTGTTLFSDFSNGIIGDGDRVIFDAATDITSYLKFKETRISEIVTSVTSYTVTDANYYVNSVRITPHETADLLIATAVDDAAEFDLSGTFVKSDTTSGVAGQLIIIPNKGSIATNIAAITANNLSSSNQILIAANNANVSKLVPGNFMVSTANRLTRIIEVIGGETLEQTPGVDTDVIRVVTQDPIKVTNDSTVSVHVPIDSFIDHLNVFTLNGFKLDPAKHIPDGTMSRQKSILELIATGPVKLGLTDRENINFRYVVDTFHGSIESGTKSEFTTLCQDRGNAFAIINPPSARQFKLSTNPRFTDVNGSLSSKFISDGGDLSRNPNLRFSLPSPTDGASWGAFFYPYLQVRDIGRDIIVPPAAYVSNNFIAKYANALPWSLVAGLRRGVIGGSGVRGIEANLSTQDREFLEPFGLNPIIFQAGAGPTIFSNKTAQQTTKSALSSINVREVVIYIQDAIDAILKNYLFQANTPQTRLEIKTLVDNFLLTVQNDDGIFDFRTIMDESNNTPDVIDNNTGIIDIFIEPTRGLEILVQRTTILRTGAISSGNFS